MAVYSILLLGPPQIEIDEQVARIKLRKAIALIAYLAVEHREFSREYLATLLWPNLGMNRAMANLRQTISLLRGTFTNGCIITESDQVRLNRNLINLDVDEFFLLLHKQSVDPRLTCLEEAVVLYRSSFLEGFNLGDCLEFDLWQDTVREKLRLEIDAVLETLSRHYLNLGQPKLALPYAQRWLEQDQWNEAAHRALMEIYALTDRANAARKQFRSCAQIVAQEGREPEDRTHELYNAIIENRLKRPVGLGRVSTVRLGRSSKKKRHVRPHHLSRRLMYIITVSVAVLAGVAVPTLVGFFSESNLIVSSLEIRQKGDEFSGIRVAFQNEGAARRKAKYSVVFSGNLVIGATRDFLVYSDKIFIGRNREVTVEINDRMDIREFIGRYDVRIPPGNYFLSVNIETKTGFSEYSQLNDRLTSSERFFFAGAPGVEFIEVEINYNDAAILNNDNPLKVFIGNLEGCRGRIDWFQFRVIHEGRYFFPIDDIPCRESDGSGYFMLLVHDSGDDLQDPFVIDQGDVLGLYQEANGGVVYGGFTIYDGTPIYPSVSYRLSFYHPVLPEPDMYEIDDKDVVGTFLDYADLPVRQYHTFHDKGGIDADTDWFQIFLKAGDSLTVETFSAYSEWECYPRIDLKASQMEYIRSGDSKSPEDHHSRLTYVNDSGIDQIFHILVKPFNQHIYTVHGTGEYMVEFRY
jgi:DNA-binding SARP family transcriptional activator